MRTSIIVPVYNVAPYLRRAVASVLAEAGRHPLEVLLVEDGSTDGSLELAEALAREHPALLRVLRHPEGRNAGVSATRNRGLGAAQGEAVCFLDGDDYWLPGRLDAALRILEEDPGCDGVFDRFEILAEDPLERARLQPMTRLFSPRDVGDRLFLRALRNVPWHTSSILVRRQALLGLPGFDTALRESEDTLFFLMLAARLRLRPSPAGRPVSVYVRRGGSLYDPRRRTRAADLLVYAKLRDWARTQDLNAVRMRAVDLAWLERLMRSAGPRAAWMAARREGLLGLLPAAAFRSALQLARYLRRRGWAWIARRGVGR